MDNLRRCWRCKESKPRDAFGVHRREKDGLNRACKPCVALMAKDYNQRNAEKARQKRLGKYWSDPEAARLKAKEWAKKKKEQDPAFFREQYHRETPEQRQRRRERHRAWRKANRESVNARKRQDYIKHREKHMAYMKEWVAQNPDRARAISARRRAALLKRCGLLTPEKNEAIKAIYAEAARLTQETGVLHHVDHIIPLQGKTISGLHVPENLRAIPAPENHKKKDRVDEKLVSELLERWHNKYVRGDLNS